MKLMCVMYLAFYTWHPVIPPSRYKARVHGHSYPCPTLDYVRKQFERVKKANRESKMPEWRYAGVHAKKRTRQEGSARGR